MSVRVRRTAPVVVVALLTASVAFAQTSAATKTPPPATPAMATPQQLQQVLDEIDRLKKEFDALRQNYDQRIATLEQRIGTLVAGPSVVDPPPAPAAPPTQVDPAPVAAPQGGGAGSSKVFNPDTSVIANFIGVGGKNPMSTQKPLQLSEAEVSMQAVVDPYARADFFLSAGPEGLSIEEGFVTFTTLPANFQVKVGKMRAQFGKVNTLHTHAMPTADRPLVTQNLVGGEDGLSDSGVSVSKLFPNSVVYLEAIGEVYGGDSAVFQSDDRSKLGYVGKLRAYRDITESSNIELGASFATGPTHPMLPDIDGVLQRVVPSQNKQLIGFDATFRYRPLSRAIYKRLNVRTELVWSRQDLPDAAQVRSFGYYALAEYQFARRWYFGARVDRSGRATDPLHVDKGGSIFMTYWPSEFAQIRGQYRFTRYGEGIKANEVLFQVNFAIGAHGAHAF